VSLGFAPNNSGPLKNRRNGANLRKKTAAVAAMTQAFAAPWKVRELIADQ
jgi:hypothetical protein